jgi:predicted RNase H-like HicB family nuclease
MQWGDFMSIKVTVMVQKDEEWYVAKCLENSVASQGKTIEESLDNLKEALELFYENEKPELVNVQTFITTLEVEI